ncbi:DNA topoisomerase I [Pseudomonas sp. PA15(2017)]|uniref:type I DNA topoisomerase n=1 Tax=Pseudomonas sp. PA15(2017) TaxID=1932111 RepID=UPI000965D147|nr:type I DNA topoisomerase [Pseudomonas sp. PA15(2017)]OLU25481.1 DNA topoisomerase I [Pseudomonas sp. PA15(2017)]
MTVLVIVESPIKAKTIQKYLGSGYDVRASVGHIRDLPEKEFGIDLETFQARYVTLPGKKKVIDGLKQRAAAASDVIIATDLDREGEAIAWHLATALKLKNPQRMVYSEVTPDALRAAVKDVRQIDMARVNAQQARRLIDRIVGWLVSQRISQLRGQKLSAGRVQSVTLRLIAELCDRVRRFQPISHFGAEVEFAGPGGVWKAKWQSKPILQQRNLGDYWFDQDFAHRVAALSQFKVLTCDDRNRNENPPAALTTATMMQRASSELKLKSSATMAAAQKLFDAGLITYHRTDSPNLSGTAFAAITDYCRAHNLPVVDQQRLWNAKEMAQEAHEAIRPTDFQLLEAGADSAQQALYHLIWRHAVGSQLESAVWNVRTASLQALDALDGEMIQFSATGKVLTRPGWRRLLQVGVEDDGQEQEEMKNPVPELDAGQRLQPLSGHLLELETSPPKLFTEASLIKALENLGIGRPSTYSAIITNIQKRDYVQVDKKGYFHVTELGLVVVASLVKQFSFMQVDFTKKMEELLDAISTTKMEYIPVVRSFYNRIVRELDGVQIAAAKSFPCPECGRPMYLNPKGKFGPFWSCSGFKEAGCKASLPDVEGKPGQKRPTRV